MKVIERKVRHIALGVPCFIEARVGEYRSGCECQRYFRSSVSGVSPGALYSDEVRNMTATSLIRDRLPYRRVRERMWEDFGILVSLGYIHDCFKWAHARISTEEHRRWVADNFSGVMCIDEVHDSGRVILYATDPLNHFTIHFAVNDTNDQAHMDAFLLEIKAMGIEARVVITDGSPLYKDALQEVWEGVEHQLCVFHVIKDVNKLILDGLRSLKNALRRQGCKGRKRKRGRKRRGAPKIPRFGLKDAASFLWEHQYLIVRKEESLTEEDRQNLAAMITISPEIAVLRRFVRDFYRLSEKGIDKTLARTRRTRMVRSQAYQDNPFLARALRKIRPEKFEKMITYMGWQNVDRTSNHVERNNRSFRMMQKTRYKRRLTRTICMAIELDLYARMLRHDLYKPPLDFRENHAPMPQRMAA